MYSSTVVLTLVLGCSIGIANSATTTTPKIKQEIRSLTAKATITTSKLTAAGVKTAANNGTQQTISLRQSFGNIEEPCQCMPPHLCDSDNVVYEGNSENSEACTTDNVCCRMEPFTEAPASTLPMDSIIAESSSSSPAQPFQVEPECGIKGTVNSDAGENEIDSIIVLEIENNDGKVETVFGEFPWMVALFRSNDQSNTGELICGGSLLSPYIVLTAAHCVNNIDMSLLRVRAGEYNIGSSDNETLPHQDRAISAVHIHPNFNARRLNNDVALLRVSEPFHYESHVNSICAPLANTPYIEPDSYTPTNCWVTGWGKSNINDPSLQHKLKKVELPIMKREKCQQELRTTKLGENFVLDGSFICAGGQKGYDSCKGDGGGPLFCASKNNDKQFIQVGIVSWGIGCGSEIPGVYASLEANSEWLNREINTMSAFRP